ncbi:family 78 glycoside hydrolase catalytic domain [Polaribacter butkevichii]|uniref:alpha-L-rhamnosidase n=1 Tax=Polaribacter butkevichii TaxID=218490 RepID=A0A2P6CCR3_9FLAO|nr:family 78 glycoside hydrolase catalytic domain [Polaribacter butkevichii]PQJ72658.1 hypothetical protein BTO14_05030 [Polaribacter butkevichii]
MLFINIKHISNYRFTIKYYKLLVVGVLTLFFTSYNSFATVNTTDLKCEYRTDPLGIDNVKPRLSWKNIDKNKTRGQKQSAYQILVASSLNNLNSNKGDYWDSGKIESDVSVNTIYQGQQLQSGQQCFWKVRVWDASGKVSAWSDNAKFTIGLLNAKDWKGEWIQKEDQSKLDHNWYRKNFILEDAPTSAMVYVASLGYHELYVNGKKITDNILNPASSYLKKRVPYIAYDISDQLLKGDNVIAVWHAAGWTRWTRIHEHKNVPYAFKLQANIKTKSKSIDLLSDTTWKCAKSYSEYIGQWEIQDFGGELIDARRIVKGWNEASFDDALWGNAVISKGKMPHTISAQMVEPQVKYKEHKPIKISKNDDGTYRVDMGTNYSGLFEINLKNGAVGDTVTIEISDIKEVRCNKSQRSKYVFDKSGSGTFTNRFNYAGGRWFTLSGLNYKPNINDIKGYTITSNRKRISAFESSNKLINEIYEMNIRTLLANTLDGIMMDCPHRERRGWGEVTVAAMYGDALPNFESGAYMDQYMQYMRDAQFSDGRTRGIVNEADRPFLMWQANNPLTIWETYRTFGDIKILKDNYKSMEKWMTWLLNHSDFQNGGSLITGEEGKRAFPGLGDWATPHGNDFRSMNSPDAVHFNNSLYAYMLAIAKQVAEELGEKEDVAKYADRLKVQRKATHANTYDSNTGNYRTGRQVDQIFALFSGVTPASEKQKVYDNLVDKMLYGFPYYDVGSSGQSLYTRYFIEEGERMDLIYELLIDKRHPSYGYFIAQGETTWPELWSSTGASRIHTCYTGIGGYFIKGFGGIRIDPENYGFQKFLIKPALVGKLTYANTMHESMYGKIISNWTKTEGKATLHIEIPVNTSSKVYIPATSADEVLEGNILASKAEGIKYVGVEKNDAVGQYIIYEVQSGVYNFTSNKLPQVNYAKPQYKGSNLSLIARASASSMYFTDAQNPGFESFRANDNDDKSWWSAKNKNEEWLEMEWMEPQKISKVVINELENNITSFKIEYWDGTNWIDVVKGSMCGSNKEVVFDAVTTTKCRLFITTATKPASIAEFQVHGLNK